MQERITVNIICIIMVACVLAGYIGTFDRKLRENQLFFLINILVIIMTIADITSTVLLVGGETPNLSFGADTREDLLIMLSKDLYYLCFFCLLCVFCFYLQTILKEEKALKMLARLSIPISIVSVACWCNLNYHQWMLTIPAALFNEPLPPKPLGKVLVRAGAYGGGYLIAAASVLLVLRNVKRLELRQTLSLLAFMILPTAAMVFRPILSMSVHMPLMYSLSLLIYFVLVQLENAQKAQQREVEMATQRLQMTIRLVQPHFLYNALNSIYYLCDKDPYMAKEAMGDFAHYLRGSMKGVTSQSMIPFEKELEHVKYYIHLEQLRFGEEIRAVYDIQVLGFQLPALTIEPLVENSVKHGLYEKEGGGTIWISSFATEAAFHVRVVDDGLGFDTSREQENPTEHLGLQGVKERLSIMCGGSVKVSSVPGKGTTVELVIPRSQNREE